jgi:hypothetical protein
MSMTRLTKQAFILAAALCLATGCGKAKVQEEKADKDQPQQEEIIAEGAGDAVEEEKKVETDALRMFVLRGKVKADHVNGFIDHNRLNSRYLIFTHSREDGFVQVFTLAY